MLYRFIYRLFTFQKGRKTKKVHIMFTYEAFFKSLCLTKNSKGGLRYANNKKTGILFWNDDVLRHGIRYDNV